MSEKSHYSEEYERKLDDYSDRLYDSLRKHGFPEKDLWMTFCYTPEEFKREFGHKYNLESLEGFDYVLSADRSEYIISCAGFNNEDEFNDACRKLAAAFRKHPEKQSGEDSENQLEKKLAGAADKSIKHFGEIVKNALNRVWEHASKDDSGEQETSKPIEFSEEIFSAFEPDELILITSLLVRKILKTGKLSKKEVFTSSDGKTLVCEIGENGWTMNVEERV